MDHFTALNIAPTDLIRSHSPHQQSNHPPDRVHVHHARTLRREVHCRAAPLRQVQVTATLCLFKRLTLITPPRNTSYETDSMSAWLPSFWRNKVIIFVMIGRSEWVYVNAVQDVLSTVTVYLSVFNCLHSGMHKNLHNFSFNMQIDPASHCRHTEVTHCLLTLTAILHLLKTRVRVPLKWQFVS